MPLSGFTRRILLQVLLEDERILVAFHCTSLQCRLQTLTSGNQIHHPQYGAGRSYRTVMLNINTPCGDALNKVAGIHNNILITEQVHPTKPVQNRLMPGSSPMQFIALLEIQSSPNPGVRCSFVLFTALLNIFCVPADRSCEQQ